MAAVRQMPTVGQNSRQVAPGKPPGSAALGEAAERAEKRGVCARGGPPELERESARVVVSFFGFAPYGSEQASNEAG